MDEVVTDAEKLQNKREIVRGNPEKLLEVLVELFPTWKWQIMSGEKFDPECEARIHFLHDNPLHEEFSSDTLGEEKLLTRMLFHSILLYMSIPAEDLDWSEFPRLYYNLEGAERLLVVYRAWARLNSSDDEYVRISSLVTSCFT